MKRRAVLFVLAAVATAQAQVLSSVTGTIHDPSGVSVGGITVELVAPNAQGHRTTTTDRLGAFRFLEVPTGSYFIDVKEPGFNNVHHPIRIGAQPPPPVAIVLSLAARTEQVTVTGEAAAVNTESTSNRDSVSITQQTLQSIPVFDMDYIGTLSNFLSQGDIATGGVTLVVDGAEANGPGVTASAIQEVKINQNTYSVEYSRPGRGRIEIITNPGPPQFHGTFNFLFRDSVFNTREPFAETKPYEQRRFYEGSLSGPVKFWTNTYFLLSSQRDAEDLASIVFAQLPTGLVDENVPSPMRHWLNAARITHQFTGGSMFWLRYSYEDRTNKNSGRNSVRQSRIVCGGRGNCPARGWNKYPVP
jgi:hypothetical protein